MDRKKRIGVRRLKNEASRIVNEVRERETEYLVTRRGEPVAVIRPAREADLRDERAERAAKVLERLRATARRVAAAAGEGSAAAAVSRQRR